MKRIQYIFLAIGILFNTITFSQSQDTVIITLENPYNTVLSHLHYLQEDTYRPDLAAQTIYGVENDERAERLAIQLKQILDGEGLFIQVQKVPTDNNFQPDSISSENYYVLFPEELPEVYLEKIDDSWYYSRETVRLIPSLHKKVYPYGTDLLLNLLPKFGQTKILGLAAWQYVGLVFILLISTLLFAIFSRILNPIVARLSRSRIYPSLVEPDTIRKIARYTSILLILRVIRILTPTLQLPVESLQFSFIVIKLVSIFLIVLIVLQILGIGINYGVRYTEKTESKLDEQLVPIAKRTIQTVIVAAGIIEALRAMNVDVTALIAGLSIGGLALALAAQDLLKNLFGSLTIFLDRPFQIGDWINFSDVHGTVEEVGFRSTRVRTFSNSLVYVPNGKLADMIVDNYGLRRYRRFNTTLSLTYDTPPAMIDQFIEGLRELVRSHPNTRKDYFEIHLSGMGSHSLEVLFYVFFTVNSWTDELKTKHDLLLGILELGQEMGIRFAFPTSTLHVERIPGQESLTPKHDESSEEINKKVGAYIERYKKKFNSHLN